MTAWVKADTFVRVRSIVLAASSATCLVLLGQGIGWAEAIYNPARIPGEMSVETNPVEQPATPQPGANANSSPMRAAQWPELPPLDAAAYLPDAKAKVQVVLRLGERRVYLYEDDQVTASYPVAIGKSSTPTPTGEFKIFQLIENPIWKNPWTGQVTAPGPNSALGLRWIGFAEMPNGIIGFHGTPTLSSIGQAASNGCVRMRNEDVIALFDKLEMGTTVKVVH